MSHLPNVLPSSCLSILLEVKYIGPFHFRWHIWPSFRWHVWPYAVFLLSLWHFLVFFFFFFGYYCCYFLLLQGWATHSWELLRKQLNIALCFKNKYKSRLLLNCTMIYSNTWFLYIHKCRVCIDSFSRGFWKPGLSPWWRYLFEGESKAVYSWKLGGKPSLP